MFGFTLLFVTVAAVFIAVCFFVFLRVKTVEIIGNEKYSDDDILSYINVNIGDNIYSFDAKEIEIAIRRELPYIGSVTVKRKLPTKVIVNIGEEKPHFATELAGDCYILSSDLKVLERLKKSSASDTELTVLTLNNVRRCVVGEKIEFVDKRTFDAISEIYRQLEINGISDKIVAFEVKSRFDIYLNYDHRFRVYFGDMEQSDIKVKFLIGIIDKLYDYSTGKIDVSDAKQATVSLN